MTARHPGSGRGLQRISTPEGFVLAVDLRQLDGRQKTDDNRGREVLAGLSPWASAVIVPDSDLAQEWLDSEAVPRSVGVIRPRVTDWPETAGADALIGSVDATVRHPWPGPTLHEFSAPSADSSWVDEMDRAIGDVALVVIGGVVSGDTEWHRFDTGLPVPWLVAPSTSSFPEAIAHGRAAVSAGASGVVIGSQLWVDLHATESDVSHIGVTDIIRSRVLTLVGAIRSAMGTWDIDGSPTNDVLQWFGARSFIYHDDIDRYEERVVIVRAHDDEAALCAAQAEADEYADSQGATALDAVQISPIRHGHGESGGDLIEWQEVYAQFHSATNATEFLNRFVPQVM